MGSGEDQTYCLRWNNHKTNLVEILDGLFQKKDYVDCTLQVDDTQFPVHRVVLAANSSYFQNMLQNAPMDNNTFILFPGVRGREMRIVSTIFNNILNFINVYDWHNGQDVYHTKNLITHAFTYSKFAIFIVDMCIAQI